MDDEPAGGVDAPRAQPVSETEGRQPCLDARQARFVEVAELQAGRPGNAVAGGRRRAAQGGQLIRCQHADPVDGDLPVEPLRLAAGIGRRSDQTLLPGEQRDVGQQQQQEGRSHRAASPALAAAAGTAIRSQARRYTPRSTRFSSRTTDGSDVPTPT